MDKFIDITGKNKEKYNKVVNHPLQSFEWGEFRTKTNLKVIRKALCKNGKIISGFQLTIHKIPYSNWNVGYLPKGDLPNKELLTELIKTGRENNCVYIQIEPNIKTSNFEIRNSKLRPSFHPLFTRYTFILDLTKTEEELLKDMHPKTRYNIRIAQKHNVKIAEDNSDKAFLEYLRLSEETTKRQKFFAHNKNYQKLMWETLKIRNSKGAGWGENGLLAHLFLAKYQNENKQDVTLAAWILFTFHDTLYYPYGASSNKHRETMASNLMMWETIKFGKKMGLKKFDMWGALGPNPNKNDPWFGFHRFKQGYGGELTEFIGSYDLVIKPVAYNLIKTFDKIRWFILKSQAAFRK